MIGLGCFRELGCFRSLAEAMELAREFVERWELTPEKDRLDIKTWVGDYDSEGRHFERKVLLVAGIIEYNEFFSKPGWIVYSRTCQKP